MTEVSSKTLDIVLDRHTTKDVLSGLLHAILFHRLFGTVKPKTLEVLDITMPGVDDPAMERLIYDKVDTFWRGMENGPNKQGQKQITVVFSERRQKKSWFYVGEEDIPWEQWIINVEARQPKSDRDHQSFIDTLSRTLENSLQMILSHTCSDAGHVAVPAITTASGISPFPVKVTVKVGGVEVG